MPLPKDNPVPTMTHEQTERAAQLRVKTHEQIVESRLTAIAWFTGVVAVSVLLSAISSVVLLSHLG